MAPCKILVKKNCLEMNLFGIDLSCCHKSDLSNNHYPQFTYCQYQIPPKLKKNETIFLILFWVTLNLQHKICSWPGPQKQIISKSKIFGQVFSQVYKQNLK